MFKSPKELLAVVMILTVALAVMFMTDRGQSQVTIPGVRIVPLGYQQITSLSTAQSLTVPSGATAAYIAPEGSVRYRDDGAAPTAAVGMPLPSAGLWYVGNLSAVQVIATTGSPTVDVLYYR